MDAGSQALPVSCTPYGLDMDECEPLMPSTSLEKLSSRFGNAWASARAVGAYPWKIWEMISTVRGCKLEGVGWSEVGGVSVVLTWPHVCGCQPFPDFL